MPCLSWTVVLSRCFKRRRITGATSPNVYQLLISQVCLVNLALDVAFISDARMVNYTVFLLVRSFGIIRVRISDLADHCEQIVHRWIRDQSGFNGSFDAPWSDWSWITDSDPDHPKTTHPSPRIGSTKMFWVIIYVILKNFLCQKTQRILKFRPGHLLLIVTKLFFQEMKVDSPKNWRFRVSVQIKTSNSFWFLTVAENI